MHSDALNTVGAMPQREPEKGLTAEEKEHLAGVLRRLRDTRYDGNATEMAKALGIGQSQVSQILKGSRTDRSAGIPVLKRIRAFTGLTIDQLIGLPALEALVADAPSAPPPPPRGPLSPAEELAYAVLYGPRRSSAPPPSSVNPPLLPPKGTSDAPRHRRR